jgi:hypothetical protein
MFDFALRETKARAKNMGMAYLPYTKQTYQRRLAAALKLLAAHRAAYAAARQATLGARGKGLLAREDAVATALECRHWYYVSLRQVAKWQAVVSPCAKPIQS